MTNSNLVNDTRFADLTKAVTKLGKDAADGADALPKLAMAVTQASFDDVIDLEDKHTITRDGKSVQVDDTHVIYTTYIAAEGKKQFDDYKANGIKANVSKLRQFANLGKSNHCDPMKVLDRALAVRKDLAENKKEKVQAVYPALVSVARAQLGLDHEISDDEIAEAVGKAPPEQKSIEDYVERAMNVLDKLITGENADGVKCQDEKITQAFEALQGYLSMMAAQAERDSALAKAIELGLIPAVTELGNERVNGDADPVEQPLAA